MCKLRNTKLLKNVDIIKAPLFRYYNIHLASGYCRKGEIVVKVGDKVNRGTLLVEAKKGTYQSNEFSPVCGIVREIGTERAYGSISNDIITIERDDNCTEEQRFEPITEFDREAMLARIFDAGIIGMGGAGFPTFDKYNTTERIDTILVNACESDDYLGSDVAVLCKHIDEVCLGTTILMNISGASRGIICVRRGNSELLSAVKECIIKYPNIILKTLPNRFGVGNERTLARKVLGLVNYNLPKNAHFLCDNVQTVLAVQRAVQLGEPLIRRCVTVSGRACKSPCVMEVLIGSSWENIVTSAGGEVFPLEEYKKLDKKAFDAYSDMLATKSELREMEKTSKEYLDLQAGYVEKRKLANELIIEFLKTQHRYSRHVMNKIVFDGLYCGYDADVTEGYSVAKNSLGILLLNESEGRRRKS